MWDKTSFTIEMPLYIYIMTPPHCIGVTELVNK